MVEIMKAKGSQQYKIPHIQKAVLQSKGELPSQIKCAAELVQEVDRYLEQGI